MFSLRSPKPFRHRLIRGWCQALQDKLRQRVAAGAQRRGLPCPADDSTGFIRIASAEAPGLLDQVSRLKRLLLG